MEQHLEQLIRFINTTTRPVFLTGKAGTGKTTFLRNLRQYTHKSFIVVAPTGIAALNAGGVTIHAQFMLPPLTFVPDAKLPVTNNLNVMNSLELARKNPLNSARRQVLRAIDLLVIDEVSMLRADLLDAIDYRLRATRGIQQPFGGMQVLFIGDLFQLPPVIGREEQPILRQYYPNGWFYEAHALRHTPLVYIELTKIFRQHDEAFIGLLNNLRNNQVTRHDLELLNRQYRPDADSAGKEIITLTTHNQRAEEINRKELQKRPGPPHFFDAVIEGEFPEGNYPVLPRIELKAGAQIMFIRNDTGEARDYVNGQLATVTRIERGVVEVALAGAHQPLTLKPARWENKRYITDAGTHAVSEEVIGTFEQLPVKLAWAITVHKSQGLTFDRAILDVGQAFAPGQVYVALSRLRSLEGLVLRAPIPPSAINTDAHIAAFSRERNQPEQLPAQLQEGQTEFLRSLIDRTFDFSALIKEIQRARKDEPKDVLDDSMKPVLSRISEALADERENTEKFRRQLHHLLAAPDAGPLTDRLNKGAAYYRKLLWNLVRLLLEHQHAIRKLKRIKTYRNQLEETDQLLMKKLEELDSVAVLVASIRHDQPAEVATLTASRAAEKARLQEEISLQPSPAMAPAPERKPRKKKSEDGPSTQAITLELFREGLSIEEIAAERGLVPGTIEGHLAHATQRGYIRLHDWLKPEEITRIEAAIDALSEGFEHKQLFQMLNGEFGYGKLRAVLASRRQKREETEKE
jgi:hypothetical protein